MTDAMFDDHLIIMPDDIDLRRSPLAGRLPMETYVLGAFNPGLTRLPNGNLLLMVRVAEALREPVRGNSAHSIRWHDGSYVVDAWPLTDVDMTDPRTLRIRGSGWSVLALTSLSWLLPVELSPDAREVVAMHYDRAIAPQGDWQCYGVEDPRISKVDDRWLMTTCSVSPERQSTTLYSSANGLDWTFEDIVLDHQNKDMLIFEGRIDGRYWAQTRPLGDCYFAYPPGSPWRAGPSINLATSPDALHWKPVRNPGIRSSMDGVVSARIGGGAPPVRTAEGWLSLWHGVEPDDGIGIYRTYWSLLDAKDPSKILYTCPDPILSPQASLTEPLSHQMYLDTVVFTTGIVDHDDHYIVASGEADLACRISTIPKARFRL
ncbi:glycosidase [Sphingobium sp. SCG-1]|uniref:glycoside hydrolase family 130 protein n=1 Tax=Sphingobium sp. SCG-1 TaxID=2072936 RepID=UPI000CD6B546|nr:glycosidase [Sphingobium sp. SCG-1]AUW56966.1 glycosidase [Sphingobium sp. SCG-1]